jgi:hypothetical protein
MNYREVVMKTRKLKENNIEVIVTLTELDILRQCLNEVCNGITVPEFETRIGAEFDDVRSMLQVLREAVT